MNKRGKTPNSYLTTKRRWTLMIHYLLLRSSLLELVPDFGWDCAHLSTELGVFVDLDFTSVVHLLPEGDKVTAQTTPRVRI